jgi:hypothetical protein
MVDRLDNSQIQVSMAHLLGEASKNLARFLEKVLRAFLTIGGVRQSSTFFHFSNGVGSKNATSIPWHLWTSPRCFVCLIRTGIRYQRNWS